MLLPLLISTIAGLSTTIGALVIFFKIKNENINKFITFCLSFSIAIMIGVSISELIPESMFHLLNFNNGLIIAIISFIIGVILIKLFAILIERQKNTTNNLYKLGILNMLALILHNFPEGIATFLSACQNMELGLKLGIAIMLHNIPEGLSIAVPIYYATNSKLEAIKKAFLSGLAEPLGAILAYLLFKNYISSTFISIILLLVAGIMITLSIEEIYPEIKKYKEYKLFYLGFISGVVLLIINHFCF